MTDRTHGRVSHAQRSRLIESLETRRLLAGQILPGENVNIGGLTAAVMTADLNGDNNPDLVVGNGNDLSVALGDGQGGFAAAVKYGIGSTVKTIAVGDFNGDGRLDLVGGNATGPGGAGVLLNTGNGTFGPATTVAVGANVTGIVTGDFNKDGKLDLAAANGSANTITVALGNGSGGFAAGVTYAATAPQTLVTADLNNDGRTDLLTTAAGSTSGTGTVSVRLGQAGGTFGAAADMPVNATAKSLAVADFNADGKTDVAVSGGATNTVVLLAGTGAGTFAAPVSVAAGTASNALTAGDFNADGKIDLAVGSDTSNTAAQLVTLQGAGDGTFTVRTQPIGGYSAVTAVGDFNRDGRPDLAAITTGIGTSVGVYLNGGAGTFSRPAPLTFGGTYSSSVSAIRSVAIGDFNGDGIADTAVKYSGTRLTLYLGKGDGTQTAASTASVPAYLGDLVTGDFNGDGQTDIAVGGDTTPTGGPAVRILLGKGDGTISGTQTVAIDGPATAFAVGDFNNDGRTDLAAVTNTGGVNLIQSNANGTFTVVKSSQISGTLFDAQAADFNNDGRLDLALGYSTQNGIDAVRLLLGNGDGTFTAGGTLSTGNPVKVLLAADFNGDGKTDLAASYVQFGVVSIFLNNGNGKFTTGQAVPNPNVNPTAYDAEVQALLSADFNGDGAADLAVHTYYGVSVTLGKGDGTFAPVAASVSTGQSIGMGTADFNGDGRPDLAVAGSGTVGAVLLNQQTNSNPLVNVTAGVVTVTGNGKPASISEAGGVMTISNSTGTLRLTASAITGLVLSGVNVSVSGDLGQPGGSGRVSVTVGTGTTARFDTTQHLAALTVNADASLAAGGDKLLRVGSLAVGAAGRLDLNDNAMIVSGTNVDAVRTLIASGRSGGTWIGPGLTSSAARNRVGAATTLGLMTGAEYQAIYGTAGRFAGEAIDASAVLVKYALAGDSDFNGTVDFNDFLRLQNGFGGTNHTTAGGDFDGDGDTDFNDFLLLQNNFGQTYVAPAVTKPAAVAAAAAGSATPARGRVTTGATGTPPPAVR